MARQLTNISGQTRTVQDSSGRWHVLEPDAVYTVDDADQRYWQTGEQGEEPLFADVTRKTTKKAEEAK